MDSSYEICCRHIKNRIIECTLLPLSKDVDEEYYNDYRNDLEKIVLNLYRIINIYMSKLNFVQKVESLLPHYRKAYKYNLSQLMVIFTSIGLNIESKQIFILDEMKTLIWKKAAAVRIYNIDETCRDIFYIEEYLSDIVLDDKSQFFENIIYHNNINEMLDTILGRMGIYYAIKFYYFICTRTKVNQFLSDILNIDIKVINFIISKFNDDKISMLKQNLKIFPDLKYAIITSLGYDIWDELLLLSKNNCDDFDSCETLDTNDNNSKLDTDQGTDEYIFQYYLYNKIYESII